MIAYLKLAEMFGIPKSVSEKVANTLADSEEEFNRAILIEEFDEIMSDVGRQIVEITENANFKDVCMAINLYGFCVALERRIKELGVEEVKDSLSDAFKLKSLIDSIKFPNVPIYHHPIVRTVWVNMEPVIMLKISEIVKEMVEEIWD